MNDASTATKTAIRNSNKMSTAYMAKVAMLGVLSFVIMLVEFPLPIFPGFLKLDFSDLIPLVGSLALGPLAGMFIELIKNLLHGILASSTGGIGDIANFLVGSAFVVSAGLYYKTHKNKKGGIIGLLIGTAAMIVVGAVTNYFVMVPFYGAVFFADAGGVDGVISISAAIIPAIHDKFTLILYAFCPFNLIKGIVLMAITVPLYKHISPLLKLEPHKKAK